MKKIAGLSTVFLCFALIIAGCGGGGGGRPGAVSPIPATGNALKTANATSLGCDYNSNGAACDIGDIVKVVLCNVGDITGDNSFDLNENGTNCDIGDIIKIVNCNNQDITCPVSASLVVSGTVSAPEGVSLGRSAGRSAAATGLVVKASVTVEAYLIDDDGNKSGDTLASTTTDTSGQYSLELPAEVSVSSNLIVIVGTGNNRMRAIVTSASININPITELVVSEIATGTNVLANFSVAEISSIQSQIETESADVDLSTATTVSEAVSTLDTGSLSSQLDTLVGECKTEVDTGSYYAYFEIYHTYSGDSTTATGYNIYGEVWGENISSASVLTPNSETINFASAGSIASAGETADDGNTYYGVKFDIDSFGEQSISEQSSRFPDGNYTITINLSDESQITKTATVSGDFPTYLTVTSPAHNGYVESLTPQIVWTTDATRVYAYVKIWSDTSGSVHEAYSSSVTSPYAIPSGTLSDGVPYGLNVQVQNATTGNTSKGIKRHSIMFTTSVANPWITISASDFIMGCADADTGCRNDELPKHTVTLSEYKIQKYEATNAQYKACVDAGACTAPSSANSYTRTPYYGNATYDNYPVIYVNWSQASTYCAWISGRLPTEAEWEKAARGPSPSENIYPWGDESPTCSLVNGYIGGKCVGDTSEVGSYPTGASYYGVMDMSGNVWEWVNDWWSETYYSTGGPPWIDPQGPAGGTFRCSRGCSWDGNYSGCLRASYHYGGNVPTFQEDNSGFRCAKD